MNRQRMTILVVAMTILALTCSAKAATIERVYPGEQSISKPVGSGHNFRARFSGLFWPYCWHEAQWYVDGALQETHTIGGQNADSWILWGFHTPGTVEIKVRAKYDSFPFGKDVWTDYLIWTVEVYAHPPPSHLASVRTAP